MVWAPPVATLDSFFSSSHHFSGHRLWRLSFLSDTDFCESSGAAIGDPFVPLYFIALHILFGDRHWRPLSFHITASFLWAPPVATQFSCLSHSELYVRAPSGATLLCHLSSLPHLTGLRLWRLSFLFCHILHTHA